MVVKREGRVRRPAAIGPILRRQRLGGLINEYESGPVTSAIEHVAGSGLALPR